VNQLLLLFLREAKLTPLLSHHTLTFCIHALAINTILRSLCPLRCNPASLFPISQKQTQQLKQRKKKKEKKKHVWLVHRQPGYAPLLRPPSLLPLLSPLHRRAHRQKVAAQITYCPIRNSKLVTIFTQVFSPLLFYHPSNHKSSSYKHIIRTKSYAQIICTNIDE